MLHFCQYIYIYLNFFIGWGGGSRGLRVVLVNGRLKMTFEKNCMARGEHIHTYNIQPTNKHIDYQTEWASGQFSEHGI